MAAVITGRIAAEVFDGPNLGTWQAVQTKNPLQVKRNPQRVCTESMTRRYYERSVRLSLNQEDTMKGILVKINRF